MEAYSQSTDHFVIQLMLKFILPYRLIYHAKEIVPKVTQKWIRVLYKLVIYKVEHLLPNKQFIRVFSPQTSTQIYHDTTQVHNL